MLRTISSYVLRFTDQGAEREQPIWYSRILLIIFPSLQKCHQKAALTTWNGKKGHIIAI